jgi:uncharacterized repeat protein (TIGR02543 family)
MGKNDRGQRGDGSKLERGLVGWWKFDGDATDSSGNGNDGTVNGATLTTDRHGQANGAYSFDGVDDIIVIPGTADFDTQNPTISAWVFSINNPQQGFIFEKTSNGSVNSQYNLFFNGANGITWRTAANLTTDTSYVPNVTGWFFLTASYDGSLKKIFVNGSEKKTEAWNGQILTGASGVSSIGGYTDNLPERSSWFFNGQIDDVRIYNRALSSTEVSTLYTLESQPFSLQPARVVDENVTAIASGSETSYFIKNDGSLWGMGRNDRGQLGNAQGLDQGLVGWWKFDGDATDSSGNGNDGTVNGATLTTDHHGQANRAYSFDGLDDYIEVPYNSTLNGAKSSYTTWCRVDALSSDWASPLTTRQSPPKGGFAVYKSKDNNFWQLMIGRQNNSWSIQESTIPVVQGNWVFISVTIDAPNANFFVDGVLAQNFSDLALNTLSPMYFGAGATEVASPRQYYFNGAIDDIRIYDRALSASEVASLYTLESEPEDPSSPIQIVEGNVTAVSSRGSHALFQKTDGTLWAMGSNAYGQLGDGTTTDRHTPMQVFAWEEKASNSLARSAFDGVEVMDGKLYFAGGYSGPASAVFESFDPSSGSWQTLPSLTTARIGISMSAYNGKLNVFGGSTGVGFNNKLDSMEIYDSVTNSWSAGPNLPVACNYSVAVTYGDKILVFGGWDQAEDNMDQVLEFDPISNAWSSKASMPVGRSGMKAVVFEGKVWLMGGLSGSGNEYSNRVDVYDPATDTWSQMPDLTVARHWALAWTENGQVYIGGGRPDVSTYLTTIESYDSSTNQWRIVGNLPFGAYQTDTALINGKLYLSGGYDGSSHSNKLYMTDLNPVRAFSAGGDHSRFVQADGSLWAMGRNNYGQLGMSDWPTNGMTAYYPFDGDALDMSGNGYDGLVVGATLTPDRFGNPDMAYSFDGSDDRIRIGNQSLNGSNSFTITMWIKFLNGSRHFFSAANSVRQNEFLLDINSDKLILSTKDQLRLHNSSFSITSWYGNWKQLAMTRSNSSSGMDVYLDGQFLETFAMASGAPVVDSNGLWLGADQDSVGGGWASDNMFLGSMDEIRIFNRELSSAEITKLYDLENRPSPVKVVNSGVVEVASGLSHGYYLTTSGDLCSMGSNADGQLGDGTTTNRNSPVQVLNGSNVNQVSAGSKEGYFIKEDGTAWAMGRNDYGQLGKADTASQSTPAMVFGWEEKASVSVARFVSNGLVTLGNAIYCVGGYSSSTVYKLLEKYDPQTGQWENLRSMTQSREGLASAVLDGKIYALGGVGFANSEIYDPVADSWSAGPDLPEVIHRACAVTYNNRLFLMGGQRANDSYLNQVLEFNSTSNQWVIRSPMPNVRSGHKLIVFQNAVWAIGGSPSGSFVKVDRYVPETDTWSSMPDMITGRSWGVTWVLGDRLYAGGGSNGSYLKSVESFDPVSNQWQEVGEFPQISYASGFAQLGNKLFLVGGGVSTGVFSDKLYVSDLSPIQAVASNGNSNPNTILIKQDGTFWGMGRNDSGQIGDGSLSNRSYPVPIISSYTLVVNGAPEGNATGGGEWSIGSPVTLTATPNPGYLFAGWVGDLNSTDANVTLSPTGNLEVNATFTQDLQDNDDDNLTNFYEIVTLGTNADNNDTDGDGLPDGVEDGVLGIDPLLDNALIVALFAQREIDAHALGLAEGNASGQQYVYDFRSTFSLYNEAEVNASAQQRESNGSLTGEPLGRLYVQANPTEFNLYTEADLNASMDSERVRGIADGNLSGTSQVVANPFAYGLYSEAEVNVSLLSEYNRGVSEGNASGWSYLQSNRLAYSLFNSSDLNTSGDLAYAQGVDEGNTSGIAYAVAHPSEFSLHTFADLNESGVLFRANGVQDGNASGQSHVLNNLSSFQLFTESELNDTRLVELELGRAEGNQSGMSYVLANPHEFNLFESIDLNRSGDAEYLRGHS